MKIGTLTFHRACNYGGALQCYALVKALNQMGYDAEVIDYRSPAIEKSYELISFDSLKALIFSILLFHRNYKRKKSFRNFSKKFVPTSNKAYFNADEISNQYDLCFIGSDQVWSKRINHGFDSVFWGQFKGRKASYAASMGTDHNYTNEEYLSIRSYLSSFDNISTREDSLRQELQPYTNIIIETVIDPTLLISQKDYQGIAVMPKEKDYVLYYQMEYNPDSKKFVSAIAEQLGCMVVTIMGPNEDYGNLVHIHKQVFQVNVQEFVGYILNAKCVIASSFHGTALPIAMRKDFYFLANYESDRSENLLRHIGALDRMKKSNESVKFTPVNYSEIEPKLEAFVKKSEEYVSSCILSLEKLKTVKKPLHSTRLS